MIILLAIRPAADRDRARRLAVLVAASFAYALFSGATPGG